MTRLSHRFLVVGADGLIGSALATHLERIGAIVYRTSRRRSPTALSLDLNLIDRNPAVLQTLDPVLKAGPITVFLAAAVTGYSQCDADPAGSRKINVENTVVLGQYLMSAGAFIVFLSSNAVFSGEHDLLTEDALPDPVSEYGRQKAGAEAGLGQTAAVVRLTKVLAATQPLVANWITALHAGAEIEAATDLTFSPVSLPFVVAALTRAGEQQAPGIFHLSGERTVSYYDFAICIARQIGVAEHHVKPVTIRHRLGSIPAPRVAGLSMSRTRQVLGISSQSLEDVASDLLQPAATY